MKCLYNIKNWLWACSRAKAMNYTSPIFRFAPLSWKSETLYNWIQCILKFKIFYFPKILMYSLQNLCKFNSAVDIQCQMLSILKKPILHQLVKKQDIFKSVTLLEWPFLIKLFFLAGQCIEQRMSLIAWFVYKQSLFVMCYFVQIIVTLSCEVNKWHPYHSQFSTMFNTSLANLIHVCCSSLLHTLNS